MRQARSLWVCGLFVATSAFELSSPASAATVNLVTNGSFEGPTGEAPSGWSVGGFAYDHYGPVAIAYNQSSLYPTGAQNESVPVDGASSASPDLPGSNGVYFVSDEAKNLSLFQYVHLTPGSYQIGFDSYDTLNGSQQQHDATLTAEIAGVQVANFSLASAPVQAWQSHDGVAKITTAGDYLVSFAFNTPDTPANPDPSNPNGDYNARDVVIDRAFVIADLNGGGVTIPSAVPLPASAPMFGAALLGLAGLGRSLKRKKTAAAA